MCSWPRTHFKTPNEPLPTRSSFNETNSENSSHICHYVYCAGLPSSNELRSAGGQDRVLYCGCRFDTPGMFLARFRLHQRKRLVQAAGARAGAPFWDCRETATAAARGFSQGKQPRSCSTKFLCKNVLKIVHLSNFKTHSLLASNLIELYNLKLISGRSCVFNQKVFKFYWDT